MAREIPKNVRQIGNVSDSSKIYIEDYVDIFLNQLCEKNQETMAGAFLLGQVVETEENDYIYVSGCIHMQKMNQKGKDLIIEENVWKNACETCKEFFGDAEILGWVIVDGNQSIEMTHQIQKMHQKYFHREKSLFVIKDSRERDEKIYINKYCEMLEIKGYYIYYEKNTEMQDYMIYCRKNAGMTPSELVDDKAAKSFRNVIQEKIENKDKTGKFRPAYVMMLCCLLVIFGAGIVMAEGYDGMRGDLESFDGEEEVLDTEVVEKQEQLDETIDVEMPDVQTAEDEKQDETYEEKETGEEQEDAEEVSGIQLEEVYVVKKGDTLASISKNIYGDIGHITDICELNGLEDGNLIFIGQKLLLP